ncbi:hypothetical protein CAPTEDRAFT_47985, partial [Capitella teleta]
MLENMKLTDLVLEVEGKEIPCHRAVMAAASPFFMKMLTSGMKECREGKVEINGASFNTISLIVHALYGGELKIDGDNVQDALVACNMYGINTLASECASYISERVDQDNCM